MRALPFILGHTARDEGGFLYGSGKGSGDGAEVILISGEGYLPVVTIKPLVMAV